MTNFTATPARVQPATARAGNNHDADSGGVGVSAERPSNASRNGDGGGLSAIMEPGQTLTAGPDVSGKFCQPCGCQSAEAERRGERWVRLSAAFTRRTVFYALWAWAGFMLALYLGAAAGLFIAGCSRSLTILPQPVREGTSAAASHPLPKR